LLVGITAGEAKNPTKTVPRAIRNTFWRILVFYILTILFLGMCIPYDNPDLQNSDGGPATASFTLVFKLAGIEAGANVINAIVLTSVLSACNSSVYTTSRTLLGLSRDGNAPAFLSKINKFGSPYW
jgi:lysine-specific permease